MFFFFQSGAVWTIVHHVLGKVGGRTLKGDGKPEAEVGSGPS